MDHAHQQIASFLETVHPYDSLPKDVLDEVVGTFVLRRFAENETIYSAGDTIEGLFLIMEGSVRVNDATGAVISQLSPRNSFGERGILRDGIAATTATATAATTLLMLPVSAFRTLMDEQAVFTRFFTRGKPSEPKQNDFTTRKVGDLMSRPPMTCGPQDSIRLAATMMRDGHVSSLGVVDNGVFVGILTIRDLTSRVIAEGLEPDATPVSAIMTRSPISLTPDSIGSDVLHLMLERRIGHLPIVNGQSLVGMITQTDLTRFQAVSSAVLVQELSTATTIEQMKAITARIPQLLAQLVGGHSSHEVVTRLITDIADIVTRRLIAMAEAELGSAPVPYLWLACGSQGRQEQTGVSDQDNCIFIDDSVTEDDMVWFTQFSKYVSDGLDACGYVYCPGDMMATNPRWCQPIKVWRDYFTSWINKPDPMAQMLSSVMFDLRPIGGETSLFANLQQETLEAVSKNSIFMAHMITNSLKHQPPLGLLRGFATIRSGEHRNHIDMKHNGVVPIVDLGRVYSLQGRLTPVNTRARLKAAEEAGVISKSGAQDLLGAYDLIAEMRLRNQAAQVKAGQKPDNYLAPYDFGDFERAHLRDAFVMVRTMQSALGHGRSAPI